MSDFEIDLTQLNWTVEGWREWEWLLGASIESGTARSPDVGPVPVRVPGSVRGALVRAAIVPDPLHGVSSRDSEFIEHRHWIFRTRLPDVPWAIEGHTTTLRFESLDGRGVVYLAGQEIGEFGNAFMPTVVDVPAEIEIGGADLAVVFQTPPGDLGQVGWTSRRRAWKPRFNYGWDWTPRIVQTAIVGAATVAARRAPDIADAAIRATYDATTGLGRLDAVVRVDRAGDVGSVKIMLLDDGREIASAEGGLDGDGTITLEIEELDVTAWSPLSEHPKLYQAVVALDTPRGAGSRIDRRLGFRDVTWSPTAGAPAGAQPWLCSVNGQSIFLQGVNWVPIRPDYADVRDDEYRCRLEEYRSMGVNIVRVWGGASLERPIFYDLCDELGLLIWQELPLCSSGLDNYPPDDPEYVAEFAAIADSYADRIGHHACVVIWGGGNELAGRRGEMDMSSAPLTFAHPALAAARDTLMRRTVNAKIVPTSPSGPTFFVDPSEQDATGGQGIHHDVHGPWAFDGLEEDWDRYWTDDDSMIRSEVGAAGVSGRDLLEEFGLWEEGESPRVWGHSSAWWITDEVCTDESVQASQYRQARRLAVAAQASKDRYPACAGFIVWLGHDSFPCAVSLSLLDFHGRRKPAADALAGVFASGTARSAHRIPE